MQHKQDRRLQIGRSQKHLRNTEARHDKEREIVITTVVADFMCVYHMTFFLP